MNPNDMKEGEVIQLRGLSGLWVLGGLLRDAWYRSVAHAAFDPLWQSGAMSRNAAYRWLSSELGMSRDACHMSQFDAAMCKRVVEACRKRKEIHVP